MTTLSDAALATLTPDQVVDARRMLCPMPILKAETAMTALPPGAVLAVVATDPGLTNDLPAWCRVNGHHFLGIRRAGREWTGFVRKRDQPLPPFSAGE